MKHAPGVKENALALVAGGKSLIEAAKDVNVNYHTLRKWAIAAGHVTVTPRAKAEPAPSADADGVE